MPLTATRSHLMQILLQRVVDGGELVDRHVALGLEHAVRRVLQVQGTVSQPLRSVTCV